MDKVGIILVTILIIELIGIGVMISENQEKNHCGECIEITYHIIGNPDSFYIDWWSGEMKDCNLVTENSNSLIIKCDIFGRRINF